MTSYNAVRNAAGYDELVIRHATNALDYRYDVDNDYDVFVATDGVEFTDHNAAVIHQIKLSFGT